VSARTIPARTKRAQSQIGEHLTAWRKLQALTAEQVAERAGISRVTLRNLEHGKGGVGMDVLLDVARAIGQLDRLVAALDPYETELGRARAGLALPARVRR
jgi:transcriptional regulator with XRE-family HTH domain